MQVLAIRIASIVFAVCLVACGNDGSGAVPAPGIVGTWVFDRGALAPSATGEVAKGLESALKMMPKMSVEYVFAVDGTFTLREQVMTKEPSLITGTWESREGRFVVTEVEKNGKPRSADDKHNVVSMELKDGGLSFQAPGPPIVFHLKRK